MDGLEVRHVVKGLQVCFQWYQRLPKQAGLFFASRGVQHHGEVEFRNGLISVRLNH